MSRKAWRTRWWKASGSASIRSGVSKRDSPWLGSMSRRTVRCGRRLDVAQRHELEVVDTERTAGALIGQERVDVAVGDDDASLAKGRQHHLVDVLGLVAGVDQGLGVIGQVTGRVREHDAAQL